MQHYHVIVVGGGLVGAVVAIPLAKQGLKVAVIEAGQALTADNGGPERAIVLSAASVSILSGLKLWSKISPHANPVKHIHVSERGRYGAVRLSAEQENVAALGYVVLSNYLYRELQQALAAHERIDVLYEATFTSLERKKNKSIITASQNGKSFKMMADLVVACDGSHSSVRRQQQLPTQSVDYKQSVILSHIELSRSHQQIAYERFTPDGPLAMLPIGPKRVAAIWTVKPERVTDLMTMPSSEFLAQLQAAFGFRLGRLQSASQPSAYPLQLIRAEEVFTDGLVIVGNAAHTLHPIAGQGLNLGLRDAASLVEHLMSAHFAGRSIANVAILQAYAKSRKADDWRTIYFTHYLVGIFSNAFLPLLLVRNIGMLLLQNLPVLRSLFAKMAMGKLGKQPKLVCDIPMEEWRQLYE